MVPVCDKCYNIYNRVRHFWAEIKKLWNYPFPAPARIFIFDFLVLLLCFYFFVQKHSICHIIIHFENFRVC